jgi:hypothetical protein
MYDRFVMCQVLMDVIGLTASIGKLISSEFAKYIVIKNRAFPQLNSFFSLLLTRSLILISIMSLDRPLQWIVLSATNKSTDRRDQLEVTCVTIWTTKEKAIDHKNQLLADHIRACFSSDRWPTYTSGTLRTWYGFKDIKDFVNEGTKLEQLTLKDGIEKNTIALEEILDLLSYAGYGRFEVQVKSARSGE